MIILDLDDVIETNHTTNLCEHCDLAPSMREELVTIQFGSFEPSNAFINGSSDTYGGRAYAKYS